MVIAWTIGRAINHALIQIAAIIGVNTTLASEKLFMLRLVRNVFPKVLKDCILVVVQMQIASVKSSRRRLDDPRESVDGGGKV